MRKQTGMPNNLPRISTELANKVLSNPNPGISRRLLQANGPDWPLAMAQARATMRPLFSKAPPDEVFEYGFFMAILLLDAAITEEMNSRATPTET